MGTKDLYTEYHLLGDSVTNKVNILIKIISCKCTDRCVLKMWGGGGIQENREREKEKGRLEL